MRRSSCKAEALPPYHERAVKNWFEARNGPSGENLVELIRHSDAVFEAILVASGRHPYLQAIELEAIEQPLRQLLEIIDQGRRRAEVL